MNEGKGTTVCAEPRMPETADKAPAKVPIEDSHGLLPRGHTVGRRAFSCKSSVALQGLWILGLNPGSPTAYLSDLGQVLTFLILSFFVRKMGMSIAST